MKTVRGWMLVLAAVTGVILVTSGASGTAWSAARTASGNGRHVITQNAQQTVTDHTVSGYETSVSCLTASLCVAAGSQTPLPARSHGVVVTLTNGAQSHADVLRRSSVIASASCRKSGCWAVGSPVHGTGVYLVKISPAGRPVAERTVPVGGTKLDSICQLCLLRHRRARRQGRFHSHRRRGYCRCRLGCRRWLAPRASTPELGGVLPVVIVEPRERARCDRGEVTRNGGWARAGTRC